MLPRDTAEAFVYQTHETDHPRDLWILVAKSLSDAARETIEHRDSWFLPLRSLRLCGLAAKGERFFPFLILLHSEKIVSLIESISLASSP